MRHVFRVLPVLLAAVLFLMPNSAYAQNGSISGQARDGSGAALPGVTVEVSGPQLIGTRSTVTDDNGRYNITALPVTVLIDRKGRVAAQHVGVVNRKSFEAELKLLLAERP